MARIWYIPLPPTARTTVFDFVEVGPADDKPLELMGFLIGQHTEVKEAEEEQLDVRVTVMPATFTSGSGGSAGAPWNPDSQDSTSVGFASEVFNTTQASTSGTAKELYYPWNVRANPLEEWYPDGPLRPKAAQGEAIVIRLMVAPLDSITFAGWVCVKEGIG